MDMEKNTCRAQNTAMETVIMSVTRVNAEKTAARRQWTEGKQEPLNPVSGRYRLSRIREGRERRRGSSTINRERTRTQSQTYFERGRDNDWDRLRSAVRTCLQKNVHSGQMGHVLVVL